MRRGRWTLTLGVATALGVVGTACGGATTVSGGGGGGQGAASPVGGGFDIQEAEDHGAADLSGLRETSLELDDTYFEPTVLMGEPGQDLSIELENEGQAPHTFTLDDESIDQEVQPGQKVEVNMTFPDSGHLGFICRFHFAGGMIGALSVEGDLGSSRMLPAEGSGGGAEDSGGGGGEDSGGNQGPGY
jgi:plastocyanin